MASPRSRWSLTLLVLTSGCAAVYPEIATPVRPVPAGTELSPPPPEDMLYLELQSAEIPSRTRDGRRWDSIGGSLPDPFAKIKLGDVQLLLTPVESNTLTPTWPDQPRGNYRIPKGSVLEVELWDSNAVSNHPICVKTLKNLHDEASAGSTEIVCTSGARIVLGVRPARASFGLGFRYELRTDSIFVTDVVRHSPAGRIGLGPGDELVRIQSKEVKQLRDGEAQTLVNMHGRSGLHLSVRRKDGRVEDLTLKEGPIYEVLNDGP